MRQLFNYIDGVWTGPADDAGRIPSMNPYTGERWAEISQARSETVDMAVAAATRALRKWRRVSGTERSALLQRLAALIDDNAERLALLETTDNGKVIRETRNQRSFCARNYRFFAGCADKLYGSYIPLDNYDSVDYVAWEPVGVCALLTGWNSPLQLLSNKLAPALAGGNTVVIKPSELASVTTLEFMRLVEQAGFPPGVVNVVTGDHKVGAALCASPNIHKISFTGGSETGRIVMTAAAQNLVPVTLELGGKSPNIIFADANLKRAVIGAIAGVFAATGQTCMAGSRLLIQEPVAAQVLDALVGRAKEIRMGDPRDPETEMGPVCSAAQRDRVLSMVAQARADGARLLTGGDSPRGLGSDLFVSPTVFDQVSPQMALFRKEVFGPVVAVLPFTDEEQALALANDSDFGLVAGIWTQDISRAHRMAKALEVGTVWINTYRMSVSQAPAGGIKQSGFGKERGWLGLMEYIKAKNVMLDYSDLDRDPFTIQTQ